ncbi:MAG: hypothetical protein IKP88_16055 [Lachnospiraceae bacterium]|nr:hypothetical protein [Lachnospiraceae bacterium]
MGNTGQIASVEADAVLAKSSKSLWDLLNYDHNCIMMKTKTVKALAGRTVTVLLIFMSW